MTELAELSRAVDVLTEKTSKQKALDIEYIEKALQEIRGIIEKLTQIEASLYLRLASYSQWTLRKLEKEYILNVLAECSGNHSQAAKRLGIARNTLWHKLKEFSDRMDNI